MENERKSEKDAPTATDKTLRQKKGLDGSVSPRLTKEGVPLNDKRLTGVVNPDPFDSGPVDPRGQVSSGIQTAPLRPREKDPNADEAEDGG